MNFEKMMQEHLANLMVLYLKLYKYHWNVTGPGFIKTHRLFEEIFNYTKEASDETAERMRALRMYAPCSAMEYCKLSTIKEEEGYSMTEELAMKDIVSDLLSLENKFVELYKVSDEATLAILSNHEGSLAKYRWFLESIVN